MFNVQSNGGGLLAHGVSACAGCGMELIMRNVLGVLGEDITLIIPPGCAALFCGYNQETVLKVSALQGNLENTAALASGISRGYRIQGNDHTTVVAFAGDGGTMDIGLQSLSGMMERGEDVLYICYDNEAYMNTGIQGSSATPYGAWSTTTPGGKPMQKKDLLAIGMAHNIPYCASASIADLKDMKMKLKRAHSIKGPRLLHIHCPCPTGWGYHPSKTVEISKNAVDSGAWILYEFENGKISISNRLKELKPVTEYLKYQRRFKNMSRSEIEILQKAVISSYELLLKKADLL